MQDDELKARGRFFEQMLRDSEEKYRLLVENSPNLIGIIQDGLIKYVNRTTCEKLGWTFEEMVSPSFDPIETVIPPRLRERTKDAIARRIRGEKIPPYEFTLLTRDGSEITVMSYSQKITYRGKPADEIVFADITERKKMEDALRASEAKYRLVSENVPVVVYSALPDGYSSNTFNSRRIQEITGYSLEEYEKDPTLWSKILHPDDKEHVLGLLKEHVRDRTPIEMEYRIVDKNGSVRWMRDKASAALNEKGEITEIHGFMEDITKSKEMEEELEKCSRHLEELVEARTRGLRESEERMRLLTDALPVLISYVDAEQHYRFNNRAYEEWFQHSRNEVTGQHIKDVLGEAAYLEIQKCVEEALSGRKVTYESTVHYRNGGTRYILANYIPHFDEQGKVKGFYAIVNDITERKKLEEKLNERNEEIRAVNASIIEKLAQKTEEIDNISRLRDVLRMTPDTYTGLDLVLDRVMNDLQMDAGAVLVFDQKERVANVRAFKSRIEGIMVNESYPLDCGLSECKLLTLDKTVSKIEGKSCVLKTTSTHCAPIHLGKEVFGSLILGTQKAITLDESDLTILRLYANLASTIFEIENLAITPVKEVVQDEKRKVEAKLEFGTVYLVKNDVEKAFELFAETVLGGVEGLCVTRVYPPKIREKYGLKKTPVVWLTEEKVNEEITVYSLQDLSVMMSTFLAKANHGIVLLDGVEYLAINHGFESILRFLQVNRSRFESLESVIIIPVAEGAVSDEELKLIERETKTLQVSYR